MKKKSLFFVFLIMTVFCLLHPVYALEKTTGRVAATNGLKLRSGPGTSYSSIVTIPHNVRVSIISSAAAGSGCSDNWNEVVYEGSNTSYRGYVCSTFIEDIEIVNVEETPPSVDTSNSKMANMTDAEFEAYLTSQGFPESYKVKLRTLHKAHPTWIFKGVQTKYSWNDALAQENASGTSLLNVNETRKNQGLEGYLSTEPGNYNFETDKFYNHDGVYWFQANSQTVAYYMDPRNFLGESDIFMFEDLLYNPSFQNVNTVNKILTSAFMQKFSGFFVEAANLYNVSPLYLAALSRQEVGLSDTNIVTNGKAGVLSDGVDYTGYYNFFNIGASSSGDPKLKSLQSAKANGWNTEQKSIVEGAFKITVNYVQCGQYTSYFQKFNISSDATKGLWHQYTTNVAALTSPAYTTYKSYKDMGIIEEDFVFAIPVFSGTMPESTSLPALGNPNNWLKELSVNGALVTNFNGGTTDYVVNVPYSESINISATTVNSNAKIVGIGTKQLTGDNTKFTISVTAQNGNIKNYTISVNREKKNETNVEVGIKALDVLKSSGYSHDEQYLWNVTLGTNVSGLINKLSATYKTASINVKDRYGQSKNDGTIVTGDKVTISINGESKTLEVVIFGDNSGDGNISAIDLLNVQKSILGYTTLLGPYAKAADTNKDSKISAIDLLNIQKNILGYSNISQN